MSHDWERGSGSGAAGKPANGERQQQTQGEHGGDPERPQEHGAQGFDLAQAALEDIHKAGFEAEFKQDVADQLAAMQKRAGAGAPQAASVEDLRALAWSSIDNDTSRDLDQIEIAERVEGGIRLRVAIADVAALVEKDSPIDEHAREQAQTIYTAVRNFPMLPQELSTGLTSLNEDADRLAVTMSFTVSPEGDLREETVNRALVRNRAQMAYSRVGPWLEQSQQGSATKDQTGVAAEIAALRSDSARADNGEQGGRSASTAMAEQLLLQDEAAQALHRCRVAGGALEFERAEAEPVVADGLVKDLHEVLHNRAMHLIEDLMIAANGVMARSLRKAGRSGLQRVVKVPQRWDRMVALAAEHGGALPDTPDSAALNEFLRKQRQADPEHYPDLAVGMIKLMGAGEYMLLRADEDSTGHFGLAARDYTHSTAPNRRFPDLVTQRVLHAMLENAPPPYSDDELTAIAVHCNDADKALRKIERAMAKRVAAVALRSRLGQVFRAVVTGASPKGVYARVTNPPFEGRVVQGGEGLEVGSGIRVKLVHTDPARAFIDLAKVG